MKTLQRLFLGVAMAAAAFAASWADQPSPTKNPIADIVNVSRAVRSMAESASAPASSSRAPAVEAAADIASRSPRLVASPDPASEQLRRAAQETATTVLPQIGSHEPSGGYSSRTPGQGSVQKFIFISQSQSDSDLRACLSAAVASGARVLLRGIPPGTDLATGLRRVQALAAAMEPVPDVSIDPRIFAAFNVEVVPSVVVTSGVNTYTKVLGTASVGYASAKFDHGEFGDLGARGQTFPILEPDLIEEFKKRIMSIDWEAKQAAALSRMFKSMDIVSLPRALRSAKRTVDPTVVLANDIATPSGQLIAKAGSRFNPLAAFGMSRRIVVFDATDKAQLRYAKSLADFDLAMNTITILLTTEVDRDRGMDSFNELSAALRPHPLYLLDRAVASRLAVSVVPTVAKRSGDLLELSEIGPEDLK